MRMDRVRAVCQSDFRQVVTLLQELSVYAPPEEEMGATWQTFLAQSHVYGVVAVTGASANEVVIGYGSLCVDLKIRGGAIGHIEDIVVSPEFRRQGVGNKIIQALVDLARQHKCYKVALECRDDKVPFYRQLGFEHSGCAMSLLLTGSPSSNVSG